MTRSSGLRDSAPRLIAEFFVIVVGVLGALALAHAAYEAAVIGIVDVGRNHVGRAAEYLRDSDYDPGLFPPIDLEHKFVDKRVV